jgi:hypothetical protein
MIATTEDPVEETGDIRAVLSGVQLAWLSKAAAEQAPPLSAGTMLGRLVDQAIADSDAATRRRAEQLEIYRASGYREHHPDYPDLPRGLTDV